MVLMLPRPRRGFTLIELLVVISIIGILAGFLFLYGAAVQRQGRNAKRVTELKKIQAALEQYYADHGYYPFTYLSPGAPNGFSTAPRDNDHSGIFDAITECTGTPSTYTCPASPRVYLSVVGNDPSFSYWVDPRHFCYTSYRKRSSAGTGSTRNAPNCDNATSTTSCQYYELSGTMEPENTPEITHICDTGDHKGNYVLTPDGQLQIP